MCHCYLGAYISRSEANYLIAVLLLENRRNLIRYNYKHSILYANSTLGGKVSHGQRVSVMIRVRFRFRVFNWISDLQFPTLEGLSPSHTVAIGYTSSDPAR